MRVGAAPTTTGRVGTARRPRVRQAGREGVRVQKPVVEPPQVQNRLQPGGYGPASSARPNGERSGDSDADEQERLGGHGESLRRTRGEAAGEKLGASPVDWSVVNVGTIPGPPSPPVIVAGGGQARRRLTAPEWGGAAVVVRARESRVHGEGRQRVRSCGTGMPGGRL